jgi:hypothetical protein
MNMTTLSVQSMKAYRMAIDTALAAVAKEFDLEKLALGKGTYDPNAGSFSFKLEGNVKGGIGADARRYDLESKYYTGWPERGTTIQWGSETMTIAGMGKGGAIYVNGANGKAYTLKRVQFENRFGGFNGLGTLKVKPV